MTSDQEQAQIATIKRQAARPVACAPDVRLSPRLRRMVTEQRERFGLGPIKYVKAKSEVTK